MLPGWAGGVFSDHISLRVIEQSFWSLQCPGRLAGGIGAADIDLNALSAGHKNQFVVGRGLDSRGDVRSFHAQDFTIAVLRTSRLLQLLRLARVRAAAIAMTKPRPVLPQCFHD